MGEETISINVTKEQLLDIIYKMLPDYELGEEEKIPSRLKSLGQMEGGFDDCWVWNLDPESFSLKELHELYLFLKNM